MSTTEKLQKVLANAGLGSRRQLEQWISAGRVTVNGTPAILGQRVGPADKIAIDNQPMAHAHVVHEVKVLLYHKPEGEICTRRDPEGRPTVFAQLPRLHQQRWIAIGRLDINSSGVLLFTNSGLLANRLMHPRYELERQYAVRVLGEPDDSALQQLQQGIMLEGSIAKFDQLEFAGGDGANRWYHVTLKEGRNREVRKLWQAVGLTVSRLIRIRFGSVLLPRLLPPGKFRYLDTSEILVLQGGKKKPEKRSGPQDRRSSVPAPGKNQRVSSGKNSRSTGRSNDQSSKKLR